MSSASQAAAVSNSEAAKLIKAAKTDLSSLLRVTSFAHSVSDKLQTECYDVFYHHLQNPEERHRRKDEMSFDGHWILGSLMGIKDLGC